MSAQLSIPIGRVRSRAIDAAGACASRAPRRRGVRSVVPVADRTHPIRRATRRPQALAGSSLNSRPRECGRAFLSQLPDRVGCNP